MGLLLHLLAAACWAQRATVCAVRCSGGRRAMMPFTATAQGHWCAIISATTLSVAITGWSQRRLHQVCDSLVPADEHGQSGTDVGMFGQ